jgi:hypothetical protein
MAKKVVGQYFKGLDKLYSSSVEPKRISNPCPECDLLHGKKTTGRQVMQELQKLEPKNIIDYIFQGSALTRYMKKHRIKV